MPGSRYWERSCSTTWRRKNLISSRKLRASDHDLHAVGEQIASMKEELLSSLADGASLGSIDPELSPPRVRVAQDNTEGKPDSTDKATSKPVVKQQRIKE